MYPKRIQSFEMFHNLLKYLSLIFPKKKEALVGSNKPYNYNSYVCSFKDVFIKKKYVT